LVWRAPLGVPARYGVGLGVVAAGAVLSRFVASTCAVVAQRRADRVVRDDCEPRVLAPPVQTWLEDRAVAVEHGNVVVFSAARASSPMGPFVGTGHPLSTWTQVIDVTKGRLASSGLVRRAPQPVDLLELHQRLQERVEDAQLSRVECERRLYVDGAWLARQPASAVVHLLGGPMGGPPATSVSDEVFWQRITERVEAEQGYLCFTAHDAAEDVVVTTMVRAVTQQELMHLEIWTSVLPPTAKEGAVVQGRHPAAAIPGEMTTSASALWHTIRDAVARAMRSAQRLLRLARASGRPHMRTGLPIADYGADLSLREQLALGSVLPYGVLRDELAQIARVHERLLAAYIDFLVECDIDVEDLRKGTATVILNNQQNILRDLSAGTAQFGSPSASMAGQAPA
jgi:hypothetical protein